MIDALEAELAATPPEARDRDMLAVYADALQARGDPRGELIAIDLALELELGQPVLLERRDALFRTWVGEVVAPHVRAHRFGLIDLDSVPRAMIGPHLHFTTRLTVTSYSEISPMVELIAEPRPWLSELTFDHGPGRRQISEQRLARLVVATPNLRTLGLGGNELYDFSHPHVTRLELGSVSAFASGSAPWPAVRDLALRGSDGTLPLGRLPAVRRLDLRYARPGALAQIDPGPAAKRFEHLALPMLVDDSEMRGAQQLLDRLPGLRAVDVVAHRGEVELTHARAAIHGGPVIAWPLLETVLRDGLAIRLGDAVYPTNLVDAVYIMERNFITLSAAGRAAWDRVWAVMTTMPRDGAPQELDRATLRAALEAVDLGKPGLELQPQWARVRDGLRTEPGDVAIVRWRFA